MDKVDAKVADRSKFWAEKATALGTKPSQTTAVEVPTADLLGILAAPEISLQSLHRVSISSMPSSFPAALDLSTIGSPEMQPVASSDLSSSFQLGSDSVRDVTPRSDLLFDLGDLSVGGSSSATTPLSSSGAASARSKNGLGDLLDSDSSQMDLLALSMPHATSLPAADNFADFSKVDFGRVSAGIATTIGATFSSGGLDSAFEDGFGMKASSSVGGQSASGTKDSRDSVIGAILELAGQQQQQQQPLPQSRLPFPDLDPKLPSFGSAGQMQLQPHPLYTQSPLMPPHNMACLHYQLLI